MNTPYFRLRDRHRRIVAMTTTATKMSHSIMNFAFGLFCDYSKLVELYKICEVLFRLLGTNGFPVKAENERFTTAGSRYRQVV